MRHIPTNGVARDVVSTDDISLAHNTNPYGCAPGVRDVLARAARADLHRYPRSFYDGRPGPLVERVARDFAVDPSLVALALGAGEILKLAMHLYLRPGETLAVPGVAWPQYHAWAGWARARTVGYPLVEIPADAAPGGVASFAVDVDALLALRARTPVRMLLLGSPNNPTGDVFPAGRLDEVLHAYRDAVVILDEAYVGCGDAPPGETALPGLTDRHPHLVRVRTCSKADALAALRVGYAVLGAGLADFAEFTSRYLGFPELLEEAAVAALDDLGHRERVRRAMVRERELLYRALAPFDRATAYRSHGNFVLVRFAPDVVAPVRDALAAARIGVKWLRDPAGCARVSLGDDDENTAVRDVLTATLSRMSARPGPSAPLGARPGVAALAPAGASGGEEPVTGTDGLPAAVLWDLDGTLVDGERLWEIAHQQVARGLGGTLGPWALRKLVGADLETSVAVLLAETGHPTTPELVARTREHLLAGVAALYANGVTWMPGARDALRAVRAAGVPTALVTNTTRRVADLALDAMGREHFDVTVCADEVASGKPSPAPYLRAAALLGVDPTRCVAVEDSPDGVASARSAGVLVLIVPGAVPVAGGPGRVHLPGLTGFDLADLARPGLGDATALTG